MRFDLCVIGGCGHVGLPLSIAFALRGKRVAVFDIDRDARTRVGRGEMPFIEHGGERDLARGACQRPVGGGLESRGDRRKRRGSVGGRDADRQPHVAIVQSYR